MKDLRKISSTQLYNLWRNLAVSLLSIGLTIGVTHTLPYYMAPLVALGVCTFLYTIIWKNKVYGNEGSMVVVETALLSILAYIFVSILIVVFQVTNISYIPNEVSFFNQPFLPSLILLPCTCLVSAYAVLFKKTLPTYALFKMQYSTEKERGHFWILSNKETGLQLKNITVLFALLTGLIWYYYLNVYVNTNQNGRDWYVFLWIVVILVILDEIYFMVRYYNLYLDLVEHDEIITPDELRDVTAHTYMRFYLICGEYLYIDTDAFDRLNQQEGVYDTPFVTKRTINGIPTTEVKNIVEKMTGIKGGELRFYYGRHLAGVDKHTLLRYFYFLDGDISDYPQVYGKGKWVHLDDVKKIYRDAPLKIATNALTDLSRLSTIILTEKTYDEDGNRKNKIKSYKGSFTMADVRHSGLDFQDDKWMRIAELNSDTKFFKLKKLLREVAGVKVR